MLEYEKLQEEIVELKEKSKMSDDVYNFREQTTACCNGECKQTKFNKLNSDGKSMYCYHQ